MARKRDCRTAAPPVPWITQRQSEEESEMSDRPAKSFERVALRRYAVTAAGWHLDERSESGRSPGGGRG